MGFDVRAGVTPGEGQALSGLYAQPANFAGVLGNNYNAYAGGLASLGNNYANAFGAYNAGLGSLAQSRANERSNWYGSNAMAEAARQGAVGNIGAASLGAYGTAANSALNAWAANQQAYNQAAAAQYVADQQAAATLGASSNQAQAALGRAQIAAGALANLAPMMSGGAYGGGGFSARGPDGAIASGSYGGGGGVGRGAVPAFSAGIGGFAGGGDRVGGGSGGSASLDRQHYSSREMPSQMLNNVLSGLTQLGGRGYSASGRGMDQFYDVNRFNEAPYDTFRNTMTAGYGTVGQQLGGVQRDLGTGYGAANRNVADLWDRSLGAMHTFLTPVQRAQRAREAQLYNQGAGLRDKIARWRSSAFPTMAAGLGRRLANLPNY